MKRATLISIIAFVALVVLHHDFWNWDNPKLVLGFLPIGLAYHAAYSMVAALFWYLVMRYAWPTATEQWADQPNDP